MKKEEILEKLTSGDRSTAKSARKERSACMAFSGYPLRFMWSNGRGCWTSLTTFVNSPKRMMRALIAKMPKESPSPLM